MFAAPHIRFAEPTRRRGAWLQYVSPPRLSRPRRTEGSGPSKRAWISLTSQLRAIPSHDLPSAECRMRERSHFPQPASNRLYEPNPRCPSSRSMDRSTENAMRIGGLELRYHRARLLQHPLGRLGRMPCKFVGIDRDCLGHVRRQHRKAFAALGVRPLVLNASEQGWSSGRSQYACRRGRLPSARPLQRRPGAGRPARVFRLLQMP